MQLRKIADIFPKNPLKNVPCANIGNCFWLGVVIELISNNYESDCIMCRHVHYVASVLLMSGHTQDITANRTHQYTRRQEVNNKLSHVTPL